VFTRTRWGLHTVAVGGNLLGAAEAGVSVRRIKIGNFMIASTLGAFAGLLEAFRINSIDPNIGGGTNITLRAIAAAVIGGTALAGGSGTVIGALLGMFVLAELQTGFNILGFNAFTIFIYLGSAILISMIISQFLVPVAPSRREVLNGQQHDRRPAGGAHRQEVRRLTALRDVNLRLGQGEVLGLIGDNGAGKSTLIKIICGFHRPDSGQVYVNGEPVSLRSVDHARSLGIDCVYQDLALVNQLSVYHNMFLNRERLTWPLLNNRSMRKLARQHLSDMGVNIPDVTAPVAQLSGGQRQAIAVARSVYSDAKILLLDEPLAAMGAKEGALILDLVRDLKAAGQVSIIIIAHNYAQVLEVCDRVNLLQHGAITYDKPTAETSVTELTDLVVAEYRAARNGPPVHDGERVVGPCLIGGFAAQ
jgi:ABC-type multidrug transport system ATPase subunit